jgi:hypothetical protein
MLPVMTATPTEQPHAEIEPPFWSTFSTPDLRTLVVTFAGTLAANVVTVVVVAAAIIAARPLHSQHHAYYVNLLISSAIIVPFGIGAVYYWTRAVINRRKLGGRSRARMLAYKVFIVMISLNVLLTLLVLVGLAFNVK